MGTVFVSYSHKDEKWKDRLMPHLEGLELLGHIDVWDDRDIDAGAEWYPEIRAAMEKADIAVCLISPNFLASVFCIKEEVPYFLEQREQKGMLIIPILIHPCIWKEHKWVSDTQMLPRDEGCVAVEFEKNYHSVFLEVANRIKDFVVDQTVVEEPLEIEWELPEKIDIGRILQEKSGLLDRGEEVVLFGRQKEIKQLDEAWDGGEKNILSFVAWGGVGKSTLIKKWLQYLGRDNYRGAKRIYGWSFYSQGTRKRVTSADQFIAHALKWFGDKDPKVGSPFDKGQRLAELIAKEKTLLILDGMEPLQSDSKVERGKIKDAALARMLITLAKNNPGLCVISTRENVYDLKEYKGVTQQENLNQISEEAGRAILNYNDIRGTDDELKEATKAFGCHALAVNLLTAYLKNFGDSDIKHAADIPDLPEVKVKDGKHPRRVIEAIAGQLGDGAELEVLKILGLFDRPVDIQAINAVNRNINIDGLTDVLHVYATFERQVVYDRLRELKLLAEEHRHNRGVLDCHPLVREHFEEKLKKGMPEAWRAGHERLYEYYKGLPEKLYGKELPDTLEEMEPLFRAVYHGCQSQKVQEVYDDIYSKRIQRGSEYYIMKKLGAFGSDLGAVACFFDKLWSEPAEGLSERDKALVLSIAGFDLRAVGRLNKAVGPMLADVKMAIEQGDWEGVATAAGNVSELHLTLGQVGKAIKLAEKGLKYADKSGDEFQKMSKRTTYGDALHQAGDIERAKELFEEAERMQAERQPDYPLLYSLAGYRYCDLLLGEGEYEKVLESTRQTLEWSKQAGASLISHALEMLSIGKALMGLAIRDGGDWDEAIEWLDKAVDGLRASGEQVWISRGLLCRVAMYRERGMYPEAQCDLDEVYEIAERGGMKLFMVDYNLEAGRVCRAMGDGEGARRHYDAARLGIEETGYHRRDGEANSF